MIATAWVLIGALTGCVATANDAAATATVGEAAPDFRLTDLEGKEHTLSSYKGKVVVLEWFNPGCPYVKDVHGPGGALDGAAAKATAEGVVWLAINSGAPGKQGHGREVNASAAQEWSMGHPVLLDESGATGRAYGATTTPHMFVIDPEGVLRYEGAVDNQPMRQATGDRMPYFEHALADVRAGKNARTPRTKPYGCSVKY